MPTHFDPGQLSSPTSAALLFSRSFNLASARRAAVKHYVGGWHSRPSLSQLARRAETRGDERVRFLVLLAPRPQPVRSRFGLAWHPSLVPHDVMAARQLLAPSHPAPAVGKAQARHSLRCRWTMSSCRHPTSSLHGGVKRESGAPVAH
jgi:hypothetical protein